MISSNLKTLRKRRNISTYALADLTGISQSTISKLENGKRKMDLEILDKIADALDVSIAELIKEER